MKRVEPPSNPNRVIEWAGWLVIAALLVATAMLWSVTRSREDARIFDQKVQRLETFEAVLRERIAGIDEPLYWNSYMFSAAGEIDSKTFAKFNQDILNKSPSIMLLEWNPRVLAEDKDRFVKSVRKSGLPDYDILEPDWRGVLLPQSSPANFFTPIRYAIARPGHDAAIGLNVSFTAERRVWYEESARNNMPITTGVIPIFVSPKDPSRAGMVHSRPIYAGPIPEDESERWQKTRGWIAVVVMLEELFAESIDRNLTADFDVLVFERTSRGSFLIADRSFAGPRVSGLPREPYTSQPNDLWGTVEVGKQTWGIVLRPTSQWHANMRYTESRTTLAMGLLLTAVVAYSLYRQGRSRQRARVLQEGIASSESLLRDVTRDVPVVVYQAKTMVDGERVVTFVSDHVERVMGVSSAEVLADYAKFLQHQLKQPESASVQEPAGNAQEQGATRMVCLRVDGADRWLEHRARYRKSPGSGALVETGYWADVSELKLREVQITGAKQTLEATNAKLLETVDELERTRGALVQSEKLASLGAMVAGVSHELNTPLGNALLASTGLKQSLVDTQQGLLKGELKKSKLERSLDESVAASELIERSVQRASELVARFKQTASDQTAQERVRFDLDRLLQHVVAEAKGRFADATWTIVLNSEPGMELDSFPKPLEQVLQCLIDNCIAHGFTGRTHGTIAISVVPSGPNDRLRESVEIVVQDNGCGIPPEIATRVFDPFFTTKMGRHVGIGLNVAYRMVTTLLGGTIAVDTGFSGGGRIVLHLPVQAPATF